MSHQLESSALARRLFRHPIGKLAIIASASALLALLWTPIGKLPVGADAPPIMHPLVLLKQFPSSWDYWLDLGSSSPPILFFGVPFYFLFAGVGEALGASIYTSTLLYCWFFLLLGAASVGYLSDALWPGRRTEVSYWFGPALFLVNSFWLFHGGPDIIGVVFYVALIAFTLAALAWSVRHPSRVSWTLPALGFGALISAVPFAIPVLVFLVGGLLAFAILLWIQEYRHPRVARSIAMTTLISFLAAVLANGWAAFAFFLSLPSYAFHTAVVSSFFPLTGSVAYAARPLHVFLGMNNWVVFTSIAPAWTAYYLTNPLGFLSLAIVPILAFASLLVLPASNPAKHRVTALVLLVLIGLASETGTTTASGLFFWSHVISLPEAPNVFASVTSFAITPFVFIGYCLLAALTLRFLGEGFGTVFAGVWHSSREMAQRSTPHLQSRFRAGPRGFIVLIVVLGLLVGGAFPLFNGAVAQWHVGTYSGQGVVVPSAYTQVSDWLGTHNKNLSSTMVLPSPGDWPLLDWNVTGGSYQGINPYRSLLAGTPVIDGSPSRFAERNLPAADNLVNAAYQSIETPGLLKALAPPTGYSLNLSGVTPNLVPAFSRWSICAGCGNLLPNRTFVFGNNPSSIEVSANNSATYGNPNGVSIRYTYANVTDLSSFRFMIAWLHIDNPDVKNFIFGVSYAPGLATYLTVSPVSTEGPWNEFLIDTSQFPYQGALSTAISLLISYITLTPNGTTHLYVGDLSLAAQLNPITANNLAATSYGWTTPNSGTASLEWVPSAKMGNASGSLVYQDRNYPAYGPSDSDGLRVRFPVTNLSTTPGMNVWFRVSGTSPASIFFGLAYGPGYAYWFYQPSSFTLATLDGWYHAIVPFTSVPLTYKEHAISLIIQYVPTNATGNTTITVAYAGLIGNSPPDPGFVESLLSALNVQYLLVDTNIVGSYNGSVLASVIDETGIAEPILEEGGLFLYQNLAYIGPMFITSSVVCVGPSSDLVLESVLGNWRAPAIALTQGCPPPVSPIRTPDVRVQPIATAIPTHVDPSTGEAHFAVSGPGVMVFPQLYDPNWIATSQGRVLTHVIANGIWNGWWIGNGTINVDIQYAYQRPFDSLLLFGLVANVGLLIMGVVVLAGSGAFCDLVIGKVGKFLKLTFTRFR